MTHIEYIGTTQRRPYLIWPPNASHPKHPKLVVQIPGTIGRAIKAPNKFPVFLGTDLSLGQFCGCLLRKPPDLERGEMSWASPNWKETNLRVMFPIPNFWKVIQPMITTYTKQSKNHGPNFWVLAPWPHQKNEKGLTSSAVSWLPSIRCKCKWDTTFIDIWLVVLTCFNHLEKYECQWEGLSHIYIFHILWDLLVGGWPTEKYEFVSWDDDIPNWMEKQSKCSKPPTSLSTCKKNSSINRYQ